MAKKYFVSCLFLATLLVLCGAGFAHAEYILRLPNLPEMRFKNAGAANIPPPFIISPRMAPRMLLQEEQKLREISDKIWSVIRPKENVFVEVDIRSFSPNDRYQDHEMIFYTARAGVLVLNGKEIIFLYSQIMIDKAYLGFIGPYRYCFRDSTPLDWPSDEPRIYASLHLVIRGVLDRLETDEPFLWEGKVDSVRFMDVYLRDIEVLKIDCK